VIIAGDRQTRVSTRVSTVYVAGAWFAMSPDATCSHCDIDSTDTNPGYQPSHQKTSSAPVTATATIPVTARPGGAGVSRRSIGECHTTGPRPTTTLARSSMNHSPRRIPLLPAAGSGTATMVAGTLVAALAAYLFQLVAGRALGPADFAPITVLWTIQFLVVTTVFLPTEQLTVRRLADSTPSAPPARLYGAVIVGAAAASVIFGIITLDRLLEGRPIFLAVLGLVMVAYGGFALGRGALAGHRRFAEYGWATMAESVVRLVAAGVLLAVGAGVVGVAWSLVPGAFVVYLWRPFRHEVRDESVPVAAGALATLATFVAANAASQTILAAGPLVVGALGAGAVEVSIFFETFLLFRAPLTVAYSLVARVLPPFTGIAEKDGGRTLASWAIRLGVLGAAGAAAGFAAGYLAGPDVVSLLLGEEFRPEPLLAAYAASGVVLATVSLFTQQMLIAMKATGVLAASWITGLAAASVAISLGTGSASLVVGLAFLVGEAVALGLIVLGVVGVARSASGQPTG
jgi:O-antigen/teichoic acid export membrane protein